jgi:hypothetical protein
MRPASLLLVLSIIGASANPREHRAQAVPDQFVIGRDTFVDFGPSYDYYDLFVVRPSAGGSTVERISLTPAADACYGSATMEVARVQLDSSIADLLGGTNPCTIPEKDLLREAKRCKHCLVFGGAHLTMQVPCGEKIRLIRFEILERDWFLAHPNTPKDALWSSALLNRLDRQLGPTVMEKPMFATGAAVETPRIPLDPLTEKTLAGGGYDALFPGAQSTASEMYRAVQAGNLQPLVTLKSVSPAQPLSFVLPDYPQIARAAHVQGPVTVAARIGADGVPASPEFESGENLLRPAVVRAVSQWKFPAQTAGQTMRAEMVFDLRCAKISGATP